MTTKMSKKEVNGKNGMEKGKDFGDENGLWI